MFTLKLYRRAPSAGEGSTEWWQWGLLENAQGRTSEHYRLDNVGYGPA